MLENRKYFIYGFFVLVGVVYVMRLFVLQVLDSTYETASNSIKTIIDIPVRGQVYDRNDKLIVYNTIVYDLYVTPKKVKIPDTLAFCSLLQIGRRDLDSLLKVARNYSPVKPSLFLRRLSKEDLAKVQDAMVEYSGFEFVRNSVRSYETPTLANTLGYVSEISKKRLESQETPYYRQGDLIGQSGLEKFYEEQLRGRRGVRYVMQDVNGIMKGAWKNGEMDTTALAGQTLYTGIDIELQQYGDSLMQHKVGSIVAIEPSTGQILAMVSAPTYDPVLLATREYSKNYAKLVKDPYKPLLNRSIQAQYRPGSTFKLVQALIGLQNQVIYPNSVFAAHGTPFHAHSPLFGPHSLHAAIQYSSNPYFYNVFRRIVYANNERNTFKASAMGLTQWHEEVTKFGFGQKLGIDLPNETAGLLPSVKTYNKMYGGELRWKFSNIFSLSIGEGELLINPLKMANLAAIIANRGWYYTPHVVSGINKKDSPHADYKVRHETGVSNKYYEIVIDGMEDVVTRGTVSRAAIIPGVAMCGKTGTSQNRVGKDHSIFLAFAPKYKPQIAIAVFVENANFGGFAAAPVASLMIEKYLNRKVLRKGLETEFKNRNYLPAIYRTAPIKKVIPKDSTRNLIVKK
ncbi:MAG: peptidoglycan glycosyltransferase [Runella slithyformis]|nr:MAG: peptidoglycan glycosyltransferase [Runella slithyformis]TAF28832.1 MAG: peptidoglycan glycosyltransferase [Runella slithyformis]TAF48949.1 MAG: peptidoglycan glycosyltransferase [Runella slithyformis]TAF83509.1 MAG: peptidoglycan glycosyltransferase [Runella slithyformis]